MFPHTFPFDPTYGYDLTRLLAITPPPEPPGFADFWQKTYADTRATPLNLTTKPSPFQDKTDKFQVLETYFDSFEGFRVGAWITIPRHHTPTRAVVVGHGYGGREAPDLAHQPGPPAIAIYPCARGAFLSARPNLPYTPAFHVIHAIDSPHTYLHRGCVADLWACVSALLEFAPHTAGNIDYLGGSFGGGIGALALPWEPRFRKAYLSVPSFGHHPLRLSMPCVGSGQAVSIYARHNPAIVHTTLPFFDAAIAATHIKTPTFTAPALFDPAVPPPGQFAVCNAIKATHRQYIMPAGHFDFPDAQAHNTALLKHLADWFT